MLLLLYHIVLPSPQTDIGQGCHAGWRLGVDGHLDTGISQVVLFLSLLNKSGNFRGRFVVSTTTITTTT